MEKKPTTKPTKAAFEKSGKDVDSAKGKPFKENSAQDKKVDKAQYKAFQKGAGGTKGKK